MGGPPPLHCAPHAPQATGRRPAPGVAAVRPMHVRRGSSLCWLACRLLLLLLLLLLQPLLLLVHLVLLVLVLRLRLRGGQGPWRLLHRPCNGSSTAGWQGAEARCSTVHGLQAKACVCPHLVFMWMGSLEAGWAEGGACNRGAGRGGQTRGRAWGACARLCAVAKVFWGSGCRDSGVWSRACCVASGLGVVAWSPVRLCGLDVVAWSVVWLCGLCTVARCLVLLCSFWRGRVLICAGAPGSNILVRLLLTYGCTWF